MHDTFFNEKVVRTACEGKKFELPINAPLEHLRVRPSPVSRVVRCGENKAPTTCFIVVFMKHAYYNGGKMNEKRGVDMCSIAVKIPDEVLYDTKMTEAEASDFAKKAIALMLYSTNHIPIGYCAQIAGMPQEDFIKYLSSNHISIFSFDDENEFLEEMSNA